MTFEQIDNALKKGLLTKSEADRLLIKIIDEDLEGDQSEEGFREHQDHQREYEEFRMEQEVFGDCCDSNLDMMR